jgi:hypothetical protein
MEALRRGFVVVVLSTLATGLPLPARADEPPRDAAAADRHFELARSAFKSGDLETACREFGESQRLDPAAGTLLNLSECEERLGRTGSAWRHVKEAVASLKPDDDRLPMARDWLARLEGTAPRLTVRLARGAPKETTASCDGRALDSAAFGTPEPLDPGEHVIRVEAPGRSPATVRVSLAAGGSATVDLEPGPPSEPPAATDTATATTAPPEPSRWSPLTTVGLVTGAAGLVLVAVGGGVGLAAHSDMSDSKTGHCGDAIKQADPNRCDATGLDLRRSARQEADLASVLVVVGGVALAGGAILALTSWPRAPRGAARRDLVPTIGYRTIGLRGTF